ncbi:MAG: type II toxin-antitoxin system VapC family toxin [Hyphomicrobiales bacterium]|nr:type II toxin-antitoxin system VapC family toxin [Hyphomicrobiales bacterium]
MTGYLLDTCVLSETRKRRSDAGVMAFLEAADPAQLFISVLTVGEIHKGVAKKRLTDEVAADDIAAWAAVIEREFADHIIGVDVGVGRLWGELSGQRSSPVVDTLIAATAMERSLTVVTRNVRDFEKTGCALLNPWRG